MDPTMPPLVVSVSSQFRDSRLQVTGELAQETWPNAWNSRDQKWLVPHASIPIRQGSSLLKNGIIWRRRYDRRTMTLPVLSMPSTWKTFLARSRPTVVTFLADGSSCSWFAMETTLWHLDAPRNLVQAEC